MSTQREMRKIDRKVTDPVIINGIIAQMDAIRIGFFDGDEVYIVPLSFGFEETEGRYTFYMHGAKAGRKADLVRQCGKAGFELDKTIRVQTDPQACDHTVTYNSVIGHGAISEVKDLDEKCHALNAIMKQNTGNAEWDYPDKMLQATFVMKLTADWITCKVHE